MAKYHSFEEKYKDLVNVLIADPHTTEATRLLLMNNRDTEIEPEEPKEPMKATPAPTEPDPFSAIEARYQKGGK